MGGVHRLHHGLLAAAGDVLLPFAKGLVTLALSLAALVTKSISLIVISVPVSLLSLVHTLAYSELNTFIAAIPIVCSSFAFAISIYTLNTRQ